ncbi:hypothetical protein O1L60_19450 [Streptomyces diastatochromogenes]|nr:hypothetical protein [Streptomyces diastatochromogenes]
MAASPAGEVLPGLPMLLGHLLAALATGWLLRRGDRALGRLVELSEQGRRSSPNAPSCAPCGPRSVSYGPCSPGCRRLRARDRGGPWAPPPTPRRRRRPRHSSTW